MSNQTFAWANGQAVLNVLHQYAWAFDANDMALLASVFSEGARTGGVVAGTALGWGPWEGRDEIVSSLGAIRQNQQDLRRHQITTPVFVTLTENNAVVKAYLSLFSTDASKQPRLLTTGEYVAKLSNVDGQWRIDTLDAVLDGAY
ncbi:nuclear transport factor 2 family protein [Pseudomonas sp. R5(2019)]|uniref:nuclear transport factor 2 family protein n=1 Tax=Pseudomonas sp. R5(2019) TaxID=2697566 RepID=UPI0014121563|nr:nuclear transport factor 2 family protein [Pseudomonas sp. R5(2019)]NBA97582.1 hypothetical protein [Pseudomonas sp. R5(2019)]